MIRLSALNEDSSEESEPERTQESIKQAQEAEALELYNRALEYQQSGEYTKAEDTYNLLLASHLVKEAPLPDDDEGLHKPGQVLKYSAYKNLAVLAETRGELEKATDAYLEAVLLDDSDVTVWYHVGKVAVKCYNLGLARQAFQEGLRCNPKHWPCLDELCTVLYAIGDYATCLGMISEALERDENYLKGLALRDKMFSEEPYLKKDFQYLRSLFTSYVDDESADEASQYVKEALALREERLKLAEADKADAPPLEPNKPLTSYTWASLGECFVSLYDHLTSPENPQSLARTVNLEGYYKAIVTPDISMPHRASVAKTSEHVTASSSFSTEGFGVYKSTGQGDGEDKPKKTMKRKKPPPSSIESEFPPKRRSARVRTSKKKEEEINYRDLIQSYLPFPLRTNISADDESSQDSLNDGVQYGQRGNQAVIFDGKPSDKTGAGRTNPYEGVISGEAETLDILTFVKEHMTNGGIIDLMVQYGICLAAQRNKKWPLALADVFLKVYTRLRKHVILPPEFIRDYDEEYMAKLAKLILVATELTLEKLLTAKSKSSSSLSPASSPRGGATGVSPIRVGPGFSSKYLATDVEYLHCIALDRSIHGDSWLEMAIRVNWAKARYLMLQGQMDIAMIYLDRCTKLLAVEVSPLAEPMTVRLVNCKIDNNITLEHVQKKLESLQRCQSLEEVHKLYEQGNYEDVAILLMPTLHQPQPKTKVSELGMSIPERPAQLLLLQDSLIKLKDYRKCLMCSEVALTEAVSQMTPCEAWSTTLARLFQCMNTCITKSKGILDNFSHVKLLSLTINIIKVIEASIYSCDNSLEPPLATAYPWGLLYRIIKHHEKEEVMEIDVTSKTSTPFPTTSENPIPEGAVNLDSNMETASLASDMPSTSASLQFMRTAHDQLGRRGWCCNNDGNFLLLYVDVLTEELTKHNLPAKEDLVRDLEQCFLCLYGHPSKKAKARGLQEHNSCQIPLTWENSAVVFDYFKPQELPTFDSKTNTISTEVQNLMRRITSVVPQHELEAITFDNVQAYIEGVSDVVPKLPEQLASQKRPVVSEMFYLLADFYFKNKEFSKALKFYMHDVCVQPDRSDSWAAMALARKSRLENKLNACEPKSDGPIQKHAIAALRCFKRAMETDSTNSSILEEYGSLCYFLHSHASRQLKQFDQEDVSLDTRSSLSQRKQEMLVLSEKCFTTALGMEDSEGWLHHYMLGKIAEKLKKAPSLYLEHYEKSARYLDEDIPNYPRKIPFYSPPEHVLEALEVYYRVYVSTLKLLLSEFPDVNSVVLEEHLQRAAKGPFYQPEYDVESGQGTLYRTESTTSEICTSECENVPDNSNFDTKALKFEAGLSTASEQSVMDMNQRAPSPESLAFQQDNKTVAMETEPVTETDNIYPSMDIDVTVPVVSVDNPLEQASNIETTLDVVMKDSVQEFKSKGQESVEEKSEESSMIPEVVEMVEESNDKSTDVTKGDESQCTSKEGTMVIDDTVGEEQVEEEKRKLDEGDSVKVSNTENEHRENENNDGKVNSVENKKSCPENEQDSVSKEDESEKARSEPKEVITYNDNHESKGVETKENKKGDEKPSNFDTDVAANHDGTSKEKERSPLTTEQKQRQHELMDQCIRALEHCLRRFPQHHKSRYRLAYVYYFFEPHKDVSFSRDLLLGSNTGKHKLGRSMHPGLFNEKSKTNMFSSFWRIPEEDIDRPGSFCTHTYKSVDLLLQVLRELNEWDILLLISNLLYRTPEAGKKFLRDNERLYHAKKSIETFSMVTRLPMKLSTRSYVLIREDVKAFDFVLTIMTDRVEKQDATEGASILTQLVTDAYECWKVGQKYDKFVKATESLLSKAFEMMKAISPLSSDVAESSDTPSSLLEQALRFCQQTVKPQTSSTCTAPQTPVDSSVDSQTELVITAEPESNVSISQGTTHLVPGAIDLGKEPMSIEQPSRDTPKPSTADSKDTLNTSTMDVDIVEPKPFANVTQRITPASDSASKVSGNPNDDAKTMRHANTSIPKPCEESLKPSGDIPKTALETVDISSKATTEDLSIASELNNTTENLALPPVIAIGEQNSLTKSQDVSDSGSSDPKLAVFSAAASQLPKCSDVSINTENLPRSVDVLKTEVLAPSAAATKSGPEPSSKSPESGNVSIMSEAGTTTTESTTNVVESSVFSGTTTSEPDTQQQETEEMDKLKMESSAIQ